MLLVLYLLGAVATVALLVAYAWTTARGSGVRHLADIWAFFDPWLLFAALLLWPLTVLLVVLMLMLRGGRWNPRS